MLKLAGKCENWGRWQQAALAYQRTVALQPQQDAQFYNKYGSALTNAEKWQEAVAILEKASVLSGSTSDIHCRLASCYAGLGDEAKYRKLCAVLAHNYLPGNQFEEDVADQELWACAILPQSVTDFVPLLTYAAQAQATWPNNYWIRSARGALLLRAGHYEEAIQELKKAIDLRKEGGPETVHDEFLLAQAYARLGQRRGSPLLRQCDCVDELPCAFRSNRGGPCFVKPGVGPRLSKTDASPTQALGTGVVKNSPVLP